MERVKQPDAESLAMRYAAASGDNELTMGGHHREEVRYWSKSPVAVRKAGQVATTDSGAKGIVNVSVPPSQSAKPVV
jgi:hypothetical protein